MNYNLCQIAQFLFSIHLITSILGSIFFYIIQKLRYKYKHSLPTSFHCTLLKSAMIFFFVPNTMILYIFAFMHYSNDFFIKNTSQLSNNHFSHIFHFFALILLTIGFFKKVIGYIKLSMQLNKYGSFSSYQITNPDINELSDSIRKHYGIKRSLPIYIHPYIPSPSISGILHPKILLPENIVQQANRETLQIILSHEFLHYKKKDMFWYYFSIVIQCIYWYLPSVNTLCAELKIWLEYECDEYCCKENQKHYSKQDYFNTILELLHNEKYNRHFTIGINFFKNKHQVEERILYMHAKKDASEIRTIFCIFIFLVLLSTYFCSLIISLVISLHLL